MTTSADNRDTSATWRYHESTKHSPERLRSMRHVLDWANQPIPYKLYRSLDGIPLPTSFPPSDVPALEAIARSAEPQVRDWTPDVHALARLLHYSNGITRRLRVAGSEMAFRAASCTGALYHIELYLVCGELPDLPAGIYHFGAHDNALRRLRSGDFRPALAQATADQEAITAAPATVVCTSTFWRNAWKYQARAYRHSFWDNGTILANLLAVAAGQEVGAVVVLGFADHEVNSLLGLDAQREAAISLVALGHGQGTALSAAPVEPLDLPTAPLSREEIVYAEIAEMHAVSSLQTAREADVWRNQAPPRQRWSPTGSLVPLAPPVPPASPDPIESVVRRRGSSRRFARTPIEFAQLSTLLDRCLRRIPSDVLGGLTDTYLVVNAVEGIAPGAYAVDRERRALEQIRAGDVREAGGWLALGQELGADASVDVYFLADLEPILDRLGNRGYRAAQLEAAISAGRLYLGAYALGLGATGLTFFDDDVTAFFSPHGAGKSVMFLLAMGRPLRRAGV